MHGCLRALQTSTLSALQDILISDFSFMVAVSYRSWAICQTVVHVCESHHVVMSSHIYMIEAVEMRFQLHYTRQSAGSAPCSPVCQRFASINSAAAKQTGLLLARRTCSGCLWCADTYRISAGRLTPRLVFVFGD